MERFHFEWRWDKRFSLTQIPSCEHTKATWQKFKPIWFHFAHRRWSSKSLFSLFCRKLNEIQFEMNAQPNRTEQVILILISKPYLLCVRECGSSFARIHPFIRPQFQFEFSTFFCRLYFLASDKWNELTLKAHTCFVVAAALLSIFPILKSISYFDGAHTHTHFH